MKFKKFREWIALREDVAPSPMGKSDSPAEQEIKNVSAGLVGQPAAKRKAALQVLAKQKAKDPKYKPADIAAIAAAAEESS